MKKLTPRNMVAYALGDTAGNLLFQLTLIYLLFFYTDILGISPMLAGVIFVIARVLDEVSNPVMGYIMDHTQSKNGSALVYLRFGPLPLAIATVCMFLAPSFDGFGKFIFALVTYIIWSMLYTLVNIPYASLTAQMSADPQERTSITSFRMIGMLVGVVIVSVATEPVLSLFANKNLGFLVVSLLYASAAFVFFMICYFSVRKLELVKAQGSTDYKMKDLFRVLGKNKPALLVAGTFFLGSSAEYIRQSSVVFYVTYNMGNTSLLPVFLGIVVISMVLGNLIIPLCTKYFDKKGTYIIGVGIACVSSLAFQFIPSTNMFLIFVAAFVSSFGFSVVSTMGWAMLPDTVEYGELKTGIRSEGIIYAFFSFSQKLATAVGGGVVAIVLSFTGYVAQSKTQLPLALSGIASTLGYIPLAFLLLSLLVVRFYTLDKASFLIIKNDLSKM